LPAVYLDSSAIVKLALREAESDALQRHLRRRRPLVSSALARVEVLRALLAEGDAALTRGRTVLRSIDLVRMSDRLLEVAAGLAPPGLRTLDAIHLATARRLGRDLGHVVTYDERMLDAARELRLRTASPS
jgi:uncharacterized protein